LRISFSPFSWIFIRCIPVATHDTRIRRKSGIGYSYKIGIGVGIGIGVEKGAKINLNTDADPDPEELGFRHFTWLTDDAYPVILIS